MDKKCGEYVTTKSRTEYWMSISMKIKQVQDY